MSVIRVEKTRDYTVMSNHHLRNKSLTNKAKGLMSLMLSLPDDWDYSIAGLAKLSKDGVDGVRSALKELEQQGYLTMVRVRDSKGRLTSTEYVLREYPQREKPIVEKPILEKPILENPTQLNTNITNYLSNKDKERGGNDKPPTQKRKNPIRNVFTPPTFEEVQAYILERGSDVDAKKFYDYFSAGDWVDSKGNKVKNWKQKLISWEGRSNANGNAKAKTGTSRVAAGTVEEIAAKFENEQDGWHI